MNRNHEELVNALTHGVGALASVAVLSVLVVLAASDGTAWDVVGVSIFGASLIILYLASTLYHAARSPLVKARLKIVDHSAIYVLIAGSYTPFLIGALRGGWGWSLFGVIWGLALVGVIFKLFFTGRFRRISTAVYIAMGWLIVIAAGPLVRELAPATLVWLLVGGIVYTAGTLFYHAKRLPYAHALWHLCVIAGSACHTVAVGVQL